MGGCCSWLFGRRVPRPSDRDPLLPRTPPSAVKPLSPRKDETTAAAVPKGPLCDGCNKPFGNGEGGVTAGSKRFHAGCFKCKSCGKELRSYVVVDGQYLCSACQKERDENSAPICAGCSKRVTGSGMSLLDKVYHRECLRCAKCSKNIQGSMFTDSGLVYCSQACVSAATAPPPKPVASRRPAATPSPAPQPQARAAVAPSPPASGAGRTVSGKDMGTSEYIGTLIKPYGLDFKNYTSDWADGRVICAVAAALVPSFQYTGRTFEKTQAGGNIRDALTALTSIGVSPLLDAEDFAHERNSMITYLTEIHQRVGGAPSRWGKK